MVRLADLPATKREMMQTCEGLARVVMYIDAIRGKV